MSNRSILTTKDPTESLSQSRSAAVGGGTTLKWWKKSPIAARKQPLSKTSSLPLSLRKAKVEQGATATLDDRPLSQQNLPWIELFDDGALYNTTLKKVRYRSHTHENIIAGDDISHKQWETVKIKQMKAATLEKLVEHLTPPALEMVNTDPGFLLAFLCTYKAFATTTEVVELLLKRFEAQEDQHASPECDQEVAQGIIKQICSTITIWLDQYPADFDEHSTFQNLNRLIRFTGERQQIPCVKELHNRCEKKYTRLSVSPFDGEKPFKFKFCSCVSIIGCICEKKTSHSNYFSKSGDMSDFPDDTIAEQLTLVDSELFQRVVPRESLACFWSKRDSSKGARAQSIKLTVDQFNAVSLKVISTILNAKDRKSRSHSTLARSRAIMKWIDIALELRELKNFSSLKAILSGLQSSAIYRLQRSWELVSKSSKELYEEFSEIFSSDSNQKASRDLLIQEGTAKYSTNSIRRSRLKRESWIKEGRTNGTIPYLGTFLTDLMMIDTAFPDKVQGNLINFEKRRKEFDVLVQIKIFQQAAKNYNITANEDFFLWFNSLETYSDKDGYDRSLEVEPPVPKICENNNTKTSTPQPERRSTSIRKYLSESDLFSMRSAASKEPVSTFATFSRKKGTSQDVDVNNQIEEELMTDSLHSLVTRTHLKVESLSSRSSLDPKDATPLDQAGVVARVYLQDNTCVQYKSIKIMPHSRARDVIEATLQKFKSDEEIVYYSLYQVVDQKKSLHIPMNSNMYYAMHKCKELCFKVTKKKLSKKSKKNVKALSSSTLPSASCPGSPPGRRHSLSPRLSTPRSSFSFQLSNEVATDQDAVDGRIISLKSFSQL